MIKALLFDKDGTLIEFSRLWHGIVGQSFRHFATRLACPEHVICALKQDSGYTEVGFEPESSIQHLPTTKIIASWAQIWKSKDPASAPREEVLLKIFEAAAANRDLERSALPGVKETLNKLQEMGYPMGIATADTGNSTALSLEQCGLEGYFCFVGTDQNSMKPKPNPEMAYEFCRQCGIEPAELLVVGDSASDREFAENAGAFFVGLVTLYNNFGFEKHRAQWYIQQFSDLPAVLDHLM